MQDLHAVSPRSFLEVAGGILHGLSYQQARNHTARVGQVRQMCMSFATEHVKIAALASLTHSNALHASSSAVAKDRHRSSICMPDKV